MAKISRSATKQSRRVAADDEDAASSAAPASPSRPCTAAANGYHQAGFTTQSHPNQHATSAAVDQGAPSDVYQLAYAQAYASLQAQFQAAAYQQAAAAPPQYPTGYGYSAGQQYAAAGYPSPYAPQHFQPQMPPSTPMSPFPAMPGVSAAAPGGNDDGLSNLLLAWYQSGYYTGRFQAMQEMKARKHR
ncbi:hypothetical protein PybrP1_007263 [[Pythium] brassicae (nom. inval.)]|nr:hypothetical protein PybrP1_007263 [[Pythium] brassicae (nom. inval.)]